MNSKENKDQEIQNDHHLIEFVESAKSKYVPIEKQCQKATLECKQLPNSGDFRFGT